MNRYTKSLKEPLIFYECLQLLDVLIKHNIVLRDPNNKNNVIIYRKAQGTNPEGWYSDNIHSVARELTHDIKGQKYLRKVLKTKGILLEFRPL